MKYGFATDTTSTVNTRGNAFRKAAMLTGFNDHRRNVMIKLPLTYLSPFFRRLNFPIINNEMDLELTLRFDNCILRAANVQASRLVVTNTELYLPIVELPKEFETKFYSMLSSSYTKEIMWDHMNVYEIPSMVQGQFDREIVPSFNGVRKMFVMAVPEAS